MRLVRGGRQRRSRRGARVALTLQLCNPVHGACDPVHVTPHHAASHRITPRHQAREWAACWREVQPLRLLRAMHPSAAALVRGDEHAMSQLHSSLHRHHAVLEGAHRYFAVAAVHGPPAGDGPHAAGERVGGRPGGRPGGKAGGRFSPAAAHARSDDAREAAAPAMGMSAAMWEGFANELGLHAFLLPRGDGGSEQGEERSEAARRVHAQVRQTMEGCNPLPKKLQPCASEAAKPPHRCCIGAICAHTERQARLDRLPSRHSSHWLSSSRCSRASAPLQPRLCTCTPPAEHRSEHSP